MAWFNGGLFDDSTALPLEKSDIETVLAASDLDWSKIDPSVYGLDGEPVDEIHTDLTARRSGYGVDLTGVRRLPENAGVAFMGRHEGRSLRCRGRPGARVAPPADEPERPDQTPTS